MFFHCPPVAAQHRLWVKRGMFPWHEPNVLWWSPKVSDCRLAHTAPELHLACPRSVTVWLAVSGQSVERSRCTFHSCVNTAFSSWEDIWQLSWKCYFRCKGHDSQRLDSEIGQEILNCESFLVFCLKEYFKYSNVCIVIIRCLQRLSMWTCSSKDNRLCNEWKTEEVNDSLQDIFYVNGKPLIWS